MTKAKKWEVSKQIDFCFHFWAEPVIIVISDNAYKYVVRQTVKQQQFLSKIYVRRTGLSVKKTVLEYRHIEWTFAVKHNLDLYDYFVIRTFNLKGISFFLDAGKPIPSVLKTWLGENCCFDVVEIKDR